VPENVHFVQGDSIAKQTVATISALTHGKRAMVIDGDDREVPGDRDW
jgi:3,4-dihydroxy-2-butanone 4-phosphate synthase